LTEETREKLREAAIKVAEVLNYTTCGTVEFLVTEDGSFYFMELNARIQVEHPITEMVSGIDLVREQICLAAGEKLSFSPGRSFFTRTCSGDENKCRRCGP